ncbi:glycosyltransferase family 2 protein [Vibrio cholerae]|nr:glycosyltransferase family 2 protein [Vibrio cholerae]
MKLSIIVPMYNSEDYIVSCIMSYIRQSSTDVELIIIDDGSTDEGYSLVLSVFEKEINSGLIIIHKQENLGVSIARNNGINISRGKFITFLDSDDILLDGYINNIINAIDKYEPDIIEFGFKQFEDENFLFGLDSVFVHGNFGVNSLRSIQNDIYCRSMWYPWCRVFKSELLKETNEFFPPGVKFCEDMMAISRLYMNDKVIYSINKALYGYRINQQGATINIKESYYCDLLKYYYEINKIDGKVKDYILINLSYLLYRCSLGRSLPIDVNLNFKFLFIKYLFVGNITYRKKIILLSPVLYDFLRAIKGVNK